MKLATRRRVARRWRNHGLPLAILVGATALAWFAIVLTVHLGATGARSQDRPLAPQSESPL